MKTNQLLYVTIAVLFAIVILQRLDKPKPVPPIVKIDTVIKVVEIHDTVAGEPIYIKGGVVIKWRDSLVYRPDTNYNRLLAQYQELGDKYFSENIYKTKFKLGEYGYATVTDTIVSNKITHNSIDYVIDIPEKTITIIKPADPKRQGYLGLGLVGNQAKPIAGIYLGGLYKDKKDRVFGASAGVYDTKIYYGISSYWKIKF